jgi:hypothetical protein
MTSAFVFTPSRMRSFRQRGSVSRSRALFWAELLGLAGGGFFLYTTLKPCFGCAKEALQAKVEAVYYLTEWVPSTPEVEQEYKRILLRFPKGVRQVELEPAALKLEPDETGEPLVDTGHRPAG